MSARVHHSRVLLLLSRRDRRSMQLPRAYSLRAYLTQRPLASPLFDVARWVSGLERALSAAWDLYIMPQAGDVKLQGRGEIEPGVAGEQAGHARDFRRHLVLTP